MFCGLAEEERTRIKEKKEKKGKKRKNKEKKEKNLITVKSGLVGMKGYLKTYNRVKYFLPYLSRFWMRPLFTSSLHGGFGF